MSVLLAIIQNVSIIPLIKKYIIMMQLHCHFTDTSSKILFPFIYCM